MEVELDSDSVVTQEHIDSAARFGIHLDNSNNLIDAKKYVLAFIQKLLLQREKLEMGLLSEYLQSGIAKLWQEVLSILENSNRKLVDVKSGSLVFTLFCPTLHSSQDLTDDSWIKSLTQKMEQMVKEMGENNTFVSSVVYQMKCKLKLSEATHIEL